MILADARWQGAHGIGRFATEVLARIGPYTPVRSAAPLLHPLDPPCLAAAIRRARPRVYFSPGFNPPFPVLCPLVFVIHDLIHLTVPGETSLAKRLYYEALVKPAARRAAAVITVSETSKAAITQWANIPPSRVVVTGNGVSDAFTFAGPAYTQRAPYLLYVGSRKPHKNLPRILESFALARLATDTNLILTGTPDRATLDQIRRLNLTSSAVFVATPPDRELAALYRGATALLVPSLSEGFCLPALEAMACGCPVVAGHRGAQREILSNAGIYVDPQDTDDIVRGIHAATDSEVRDRAIAEGRLRACEFSWDQTAARVTKVLDAVA